jgi:hypothetical protein
MAMPHSATPYIAIAVVIVVMALRMGRTLGSRRINMNGLWVVPVIMIAYAIGDLYLSPPRGPLAIAALVLATLAGVVVGWWRGRLIRIDFDPVAGVLMSRPSPAAMIFILVLVGVRYALGYWIAQSGRGGNLLFASNALLFFGFTTLGVARIEMWLRCRRLKAGGLSEIF